MDFSDIKFLVVDDSKMIRRQVCKTLETVGAKSIVEADNGAAALAALNEHHEQGQPFNFIISDVNMPEMNGFELFAAVKSNAALKGAIFVFLTSEEIEDGEVSAVPDGILRKPIIGEAILAALQTIAGNRKAS